MVAENVDSIVIRVTTSDISIPFTDKVLIILPPPIIVSIIPETISPGDTAQIILQRRNSDGTIVDFSEGDSFEIGMIEGCEGGQILYGDSLAPYFEEVYQPIYFVADSSVTDTSITVGVRVGLIEESIGSGRPSILGGGQTENKTVEKNKRTIANKTRNKTNTPILPLDNTMSLCFNGTIEQNLMGKGSWVVGNECEEEIVVCETLEPQELKMNLL